jgi:SAM-dependent methyltransferase
MPNDTSRARDFYDRSYASSDEWLHRWRELGAGVKADHICRLIRDLREPKEVIEVGCGEGAVLVELARRRVGNRRVGIDVSPEAVQRAASRPEIIEARVFDGARIEAPDDAYDLAICTHVLEHVTAPLALLEEITRVAARAIVIEVPLEDNLLARRPAARGLSQNAGHVQSFNRRSVRRLIAATGWQVRGELLDSLPPAVYTFEASNRLAIGKGYAKWALRAALAAVPWLGERLITLHYCVLATPSAAGRSQP